MARTTIHSERVKRIGNTILIPLPDSVSEVIPGGCQCEHCSQPGAAPARWDALAVCAKEPDGHDTTWRVHAPEIRVENVMCQCARCRRGRTK